ncbi:MAG: hypothetical protein NVSMB26_04250 [Beijerinckiaceae bacterium]
MSAEARLAGCTVAIVHPAWHSCGTATVVASQARAYRGLGARVLSLALSDQPVFGLVPERLARAYFAATPELVADRRVLTGVSRGGLLNPLTLGGIGWSFAHGDHAATYVALARNSAVPPGLEGKQVDLIHCNHFFCMPLAARLRAVHGPPILLETHDIQAKQYVLRNKGGWRLPPQATYEEMLATELGWLRKADLLIHLNSDEEAAFRALLPDSRHTLLYPAVEPMPTAPGGGDFVIVASANLPNILSLEWFLREVVTQVGDIPLAIYGNVDREIRRRDPAFYKRFARYFRGQVGDIGAAYASAACVLLPTIEGHGLSIKTVEALASGVPLIATSHAFRGVDIDPTALANVTIAEDPSAFAAALRKLASEPPDASARQTSATRRLYEARFSSKAYAAALEAIVAPFL